MAKRRMRFGTWCKYDPEDTRKIVYTFCCADGTTKYFTSDDIVSFEMIGRIRNAWISKIVDVKNEFEDAWHAYLYED